MTEKEKPNYPLTEKVRSAILSLSELVGGKVFTEKCEHENGELYGIIFAFGESKENCSLTWGISHGRMVIKLPGEHVHLLRGFEGFSFDKNEGRVAIIDRRGKKVFLECDEKGQLTSSLSEKH